MTHLANLPVNNSLHLRCRRHDSSRQPACKQLFTPPLYFPKFRQPIWPTASGAISAHSHKKRASKRASGIASYNVFSAQNTEKSGYSLPVYGFPSLQHSNLGTHYPFMDFISPLSLPKFRLMPHAFLVGHAQHRRLCKA